MKTGLLPRLLASLLLVLLASPAAFAQFDFSQIGEAGGLGGGLGGDHVSITTEFVTAPGSNVGQLQVTAIIDPGWHIYSLTQQAGGTMPTAIEVSESEDYRLLGEFKTEQKPEIKNSPHYKVPLEEHYGVVTWTAPLALAEGITPSELKMALEVKSQACKEGECIPLTLNSTASYAGEQADLPPLLEQSPGETGANDKIQFVKATPAEPFTKNKGDSKWNIQFHGKLEPSVVQPGQTAKLRFTAEPQGQYHIYAWEPQVAKMVKVTQLAVELPLDWTMSDPVPSEKPHFKAAEFEGGPDLRYHEKPVTWTIDIRVPDEAESGSYNLEGAAAFHTCTDTQCDAPDGLLFRVPIVVGDQPQQHSVPLSFSLLPPDPDTSPYKQAAELVASMREGMPSIAAGELSANEPSTTLDLDSLTVENDKEYSLGVVILFALLGGFILNFMPCVLPVIGLKVMSFVQQAGNSRAKIFALNMWYVLGLMSIFWVLATMAVVWNVGVEAQFGNDGFRVIMTAIIFAMALSFLGVWEIPIPGFAGSSKAIEAAEKEGALGALTKGAITTILATPCLAPGMGTASGWCIGKPIPIVYLVFSAVGLGMALPYIAIGINPKLVSFLPKPGAWMDTFKEAMGFLLLATVIFFFTFISWELLVPTLTLMFGIWAGAWWIGRTPVYAEFHVKARSWAFGSAFAALIGIVAFTLLVDVSQSRLNSFVEGNIAEQKVQAAELEELAEMVPEVDEDEIPWQPFSEEKLKQLAAENRTIMIDFTADWCLSCKALESGVLNTQSVRESLQENNVETLIADWTDGDKNITKMLHRLGSRGVPVLAIFPAGRPNEPIVLKDSYSQATLLEKLKQAGPSRQAEQRETVAKKPENVRGA